MGKDKFPNLTQGAQRAHQGVFVIVCTPQLPILGRGTNGVVGVAPSTALCRLFVSLCIPG